MRHPFYLCILLGLWLLAGCGPRVTTYQPTKADLSKYQTFAYLPNAKVDMAAGEENSERVGSEIVRAVNRQMKRVGYDVNRENPDLLVMIDVIKQQRTETETQPVYGYATYPYATYGVNRVSPYYGNYYYSGYYNYNRVVGYDTETYQYTDGEVIISLIDRNTGDTVWQGVGTKDIYSGNPTSKIADMVDDIFEEFKV